jgi:hypothetical protein
MRITKDNWRQVKPLSQVIIEMDGEVFIDVVDEIEDDDYTEDMPIKLKRWGWFTISDPYKMVFTLDKEVLDILKEELLQ